MTQMLNPDLQINTEVCDMKTTRQLNKEVSAIFNRMCNFDPFGTISGAFQGNHNSSEHKFLLHMISSTPHLAGVS